MFRMIRRGDWPGLLTDEEPALPMALDTSTPFFTLQSFIIPQSVALSAG